MHRYGQSHFDFHSMLHNNFSKLYIYQTLLTIAKSLIGVFIPVYLYKLGYSLIDILLYSSGISIMHILIAPLTIKLIKKLGFKWTLFLSTPIFIAHITCLNLAQNSLLFFNLSWITYGLYAEIFWPAYHSEVAVRGSSKHRASQLGNMQILVTLVSTLTPLIGGYILETQAFLNLVIISSIIVFIGIIPLLLSKDIKLMHYEFKYSTFIRLLKDTRTTKDKIAFMSDGIQTGLLSLHLWPIFLFILLSQSFLNLGFLLTGISFFSIILLLIIKSYIDKKNKHHIIKEFSKLIALAWLLRTFILFFSSFALYIIEGSTKLIKSVFDLSFSSVFYNNAKKLNYMDYIMTNELCYHLSKMIFTFLIFIPILLIFGENMVTFSSIISFGIIFSLGLSFLAEQ